MVVGLAVAVQLVQGRWALWARSPKSSAAGGLLVGGGFQIGGPVLVVVSEPWWALASPSPNQH